jgi:hypothetical protein
MPCDRAPKTSVAGATVVDTSGGRADTPQWPDVLRSYRGPRTGRRDMRVAREPERPCRFRRDCRLESRHPKLQVDPQLSSRAGGDEKRTKRRYRQAKATKRGETDGRESQHPVVPTKQGNHTEGTLWRERSEANCLTSGCKSRRRRSPCGAVVISGSSRGDSGAGSPDVKAPGGQVGSEPLRSGQHRGQVTSEGRSESERTKRRNWVPARS